MFEIVTKDFAVGVKTSSNGGFGPEHWAERATNHIVAVSDEAPQPIRDQAHAFREKVKLTAEFYIKQASKATERPLHPSCGIRDITTSPPSSARYKGDTHGDYSSSLHVVQARAFDGYA